MREVREWDSNGTVFGFNPSIPGHDAGEFGHNDFYPVVMAAAQAFKSKASKERVSIICGTEQRKLVKTLKHRRKSTIFISSSISIVHPEVRFFDVHHVYGPFWQVTGKVDGKKALLAMIALDEIRGRLAEVFSLKSASEGHCHADLCGFMLIYHHSIAILYSYL